MLRHKIELDAMKRRHFIELLRLQTEHKFERATGFRADELIPDMNGTIAVVNQLPRAGLEIYRNCTVITQGNTFVKLVRTEQVDELRFIIRAEDMVFKVSVVSPKSPKLPPDDREGYNTFIAMQADSCQKHMTKEEGYSHFYSFDEPSQKSGTIEARLENIISLLES